VGHANKSLAPKRAGAGRLSMVEAIAFRNARCDFVGDIGHAAFGSDP
jgi:hypothetical protein